MRLISKAILAGLGTVALAGSAYAAERSLHKMQVAAPDGMVVQVSYAGDQRPDVAFVPVQVTAMPIADPAFADIDRMFASMDAQMAAMMHMASAMPAMPVTADGKPDLAALKPVPGGTVSYSYYASSTGANGCTRTVQMRSTGEGAQPKIVRTSAGDCTAGAEEPAAKAPPAAGRDTI